MSISTVKGDVVDIELWTKAEDVEASALAQLKNIAALPWVFHHVAVMPDVHWGKGATVGSVIAMKGAVSPAAVGVDIGCGMGAVKTSIRAQDLPDSLSKLRSDIEAAIPVGFNSHEDHHVAGDGIGAFWLPAAMASLFAEFPSLSSGVQDLEGRARLQVGTLGGGNHFIEVCLDGDGCVWLMLHSGSRHIGKCLAEQHLGIAKTMEHNKRLPDPDLSVFLAGTPEFQAYRRDLLWAQSYALLNRRLMFNLLTSVFMKHFPKAEFRDPILCHHNYVSEERHFDEDVIVTRKGAIRAGRGEMGIIPGSMGTCSYIVEGLGSEQSFCSASHGAGRRMSRGAAKRSFTVTDLQTQTAGVECRKDDGVLDEIPGAYKNIDEVIANQADLVRVVAKLKQVVCVKG